MRYAGVTQSEFVAQQAPHVVGRLRFQSQRDADLLTVSVPRLRSLANPGRVRRVDRLSYLDNAPLDFCYGWVMTKEGVHIAFLPIEVAHLFEIKRVA